MYITQIYYCLRFDDLTMFTQPDLSTVFIGSPMIMSIYLIYYVAVMLEFSTVM